VEDFVGDFLRAAHAVRTGENPAETVRQMLQQRPEQKPIAAEIEAISDDDLLAILDEAEAMGLDRLLEEEG
jgi:hypothetical protein